MAKTSNNAMLKGLRGRIGQEFVIKQYWGKTVITRFPCPRNKKRTDLQKLYNNKFAEAVGYAKGILRDPKKKKAMSKKAPAGRSVYHMAVSEYLSR